MRTSKALRTSHNYLKPGVVEHEFLLEQRELAGAIGALLVQAALRHLQPALQRLHLQRAHAHTRRAATSACDTLKRYMREVQSMIMSRCMFDVTTAPPTRLTATLSAGLSSCCCRSDFICVSLELLSASRCARLVSASRLSSDSSSSCLTFSSSSCTDSRKWRE